MRLPAFLRRLRQILRPIQPRWMVLGELTDRADRWGYDHQRVIGSSRFRFVARSMAHLWVAMHPHGEAQVLTLQALRDAACNLRETGDAAPITWANGQQVDLAAPGFRNYAQAEFERREHLARAVQKAEAAARRRGSSTTTVLAG